MILIRNAVSFGYQEIESAEELSLQAFGTSRLAGIFSGNVGEEGRSGPPEGQVLDWCH